MADPKRKVVQHFLISELRSEVRRLQDEGWEPEGRMDIADGLYSMYMVKNEGRESIGVDMKDFVHPPVNEANNGRCGQPYDPLIHRWLDTTSDTSITQDGKFVTFTGEYFSRLSEIIEKIHRKNYVIGYNELELSPAQQQLIVNFVQQWFPNK